MQVARQFSQSAPITLPRLPGTAKPRQPQRVAAPAGPRLAQWVALMRQVLPLVLKPPTATTPEEQELIWAAALEALESKTAVRHKLTVLCREYGWSYQGLFATHRQELAAKGYVVTR